LKYEIRLSAPCGDIVPLIYVADAKARSRAAAGGTEFHDPTYKGSLEGFAADLLHEALEGRLTVCDQCGSTKTADALIKETESAGELVLRLRFVGRPPDWEALRLLQHQADQERTCLVQAKLDRGEGLGEHETLDPRPWDYTSINVGRAETDWTMTRLGALSATLKALNAWALDRGDEFAISHDGVGWGDERGWVLPAKTMESPSPSPARPVQVEQQWRERLLATVITEGFTPLALPIVRSGKECPVRQKLIKSLVDSGVMTKSVFDKAWKALLKDGLLARAPVRR
jgi:hypothetical protein